MIMRSLLLFSHNRPLATTGETEQRRGCSCVSRREVTKVKCEHLSDLRAVVSFWNDWSLSLSLSWLSSGHRYVNTPATKNGVHRKAHTACTDSPPQTLTRLSGLEPTYRFVLGVRDISLCRRRGGSVSLFLTSSLPPTIGDSARRFR
jgi:hypothetical protein